MSVHGLRAASSLQVAVSLRATAFSQTVLGRFAAQVAVCLRATAFGQTVFGSFVAQVAVCLRATAHGERKPRQLRCQPCAQECL